MTPQEAEPDSVTVQDSPVEAWVSSGLLQGQGTERSSVCMGHLEGGHPYLHYLHHSLVSGQTIGREQSLTLQQKIRLKMYRAWPAHQNRTQLPPQSVSPIRKLP